MEAKRLRIEAGEEWCDGRLVESSAAEMVRPDPKTIVSEVGNIVRETASAP